MGEVRGDFSWAWRQSLAEGLWLHLQVTSEVTSLGLMSPQAQRAISPRLLPRPSFYHDTNVAAEALRAMWGLDIRQWLFKHHPHYSSTIPVFLRLHPLLGAPSPGKGLCEGLGVLLARDCVQSPSPSLPVWKGAPREQHGQGETFVPVAQ